MDCLIFSRPKHACMLPACIAQKSDHDHSISPFLGCFWTKKWQNLRVTQRNMWTHQIYEHFATPKIQDFKWQTFFGKYLNQTFFWAQKLLFFFSVKVFFGWKKILRYQIHRSWNGRPSSSWICQKGGRRQKGESWFFFFLPIPHLVGCVCFFCWWISDPFFFHQKSWWNSNKAQAAGRNLAKESIDKHPTSRGVSCFKSSLLVQGSCWQYQNKNITFTELRHYISRLLGKWFSSSIDGIYFSSQRGYVQCLEQVNQTYSPNADCVVIFHPRKRIRPPKNKHQQI